MMILTYNHPTPTYTVTGGSLVTDASIMSDRKVSTITRISWPLGVQTISTTCSVIASFEEQPIRAVAILNSSLPVGLKVELYGKRVGDTDYSYNLGADSLTQKLVKRIEGGTGAVWVLPVTNDKLIGIKIVYYNDVNGVTYLNASDTFDTGQCIFSDGIEFLIQTDWTLGNKVTSLSKRSLGSQPSRVSRPGYRTLEVTPIFGDDDDMRGSGLSNGSNWQEVSAVLRQDPYALAIARTDTSDNIQKTSIYGEITRIPDVTHKSGAYYQPNILEIEEIPA